MDRQMVIFLLLHCIVFNIKILICMHFNIKSLLINVKSLLIHAIYAPISDVLRFCRRKKDFPSPTVI